MEVYAHTQRGMCQTKQDLLTCGKDGCFVSPGLCLREIFEIMSESFCTTGGVTFQNVFLNPNHTLPFASLSLSSFNLVLVASFSFHRLQFMIY